MAVAFEEFTTYQESITNILDSIDAKSVLQAQTHILLKPNLINSSPHPVTTPMDCCEAIVNYIRSCSDAEIVIAEGCGDSVLETEQIFETHGYVELVDRYNVALLDLNHASLVKKSNSSCRVFPEMMLPEIAFSHYIISVPVLKAHSLATITGTLKNMMGFAPPKHYSGSHGSWKKSVFHARMHQSISDLCSYIKPQLSIMDATVGLADFHLGGNRCNPPVNKILASYDPFELDREAAALLNLDWRDIPHLRE